MAMKGTPCCSATSATAAVSISIAVTPNLDLRNSLYAALSPNTLALHSRSTHATAGRRRRGPRGRGGGPPACHLPGTPPPAGTTHTLFSRLLPLPADRPLFLSTLS